MPPEEHTSQAIDREDLRPLVGGGVLMGRLYAGALEFFRDAAAWQGWALSALLALGVGHVLAGIIFFFAFNWNDLSSGLKFLIVQGGIVVAVLCWLCLRLDKPLAQAFGIAATVLVGVHLAVFGQVYQTPSTIHAPFTFWAILTLPFAMVSRSLGHWAVWLVIFWVAAGMYIEEEIRPENALHAEYALIGLGILYLTLLLVYNELGQRLFRWTRAAWFEAALLVAGLSIPFALFAESLWPLGNGLVLMSAPILTGLMIAYYYFWRRSLPGLALSIFFAAMILALAGIKVIFEGADDFDNSFVGLIFLCALWMIFITGMTGVIYRRLYIQSGLSERGSMVARKNADSKIAPIALDEFAAFMGLDPAAVSAVLGADNERDAPWYMELFLAFSGIIAAIFVSLFFGLFLGITLDLDSGAAVMVTGLVVYGGAAAGRIKTDQSFLRHMLNTILLGGGALALVGFGMMTENTEAICLAGIALSVLTIVILNDRLLEFLMALGITGFFLGLIYEMDLAFTYTLMSLFCTGLGVVCLVLPFRNRLYDAAGTAFLLALPIYAIGMDSIEEQFALTDGWALRGISILIMLAAIGFLNVVNRKIDKFRPHLFILLPLLIAVALMPVGSAAALLAVIAGYVLGLRVLAVIGVCLQAYFVFVFYYDLTLTLLEKSVLLVASGLVFVTVWGLVNRREGRAA